jgi:hypothetical protein
VSRRRSRRWAWLLALLLTWAVASYIVVPILWKQYFRRHPGLADAPRVSHTADGHPGDPINIALLGSKEEVIRAMTAAGWFPADPITFESSARIVLDSVLRRPDDRAPVSNLYLFGRRQDLAFEQPVGDSPRRRHHVRFWLWDRRRDNRPVWFGAVTFDERVGVSDTTGQVTHHIGPDVDAERDLMETELRRVRWAHQLQWIDDFQRERQGVNGGGDPWRTDGRLAVVVLGTPAP